MLPSPAPPTGLRGTAVVAKFRLKGSRVRPTHLTGGGQAPSRPPPVEGREAGRAKPALGVHHVAMASVANINDVLEGHVALEIECVDRLYLNAYMPALQVGGQVIRFLCGHLGRPIASSALFEPIGNRFRREISGTRPSTDPDP